jgi:dinuclear metal center YbgI/SA1388 family protein
MQIKNIISALTEWAPPAYQENYDNCGLITGNVNWLCTGMMCTLDATEEVIQDAVEKKCNLLIAHHPIVFRGLKSLAGTGYVERAIVKAIKNDIAIYAIHTNLDNVLHGVNAAISDKLHLEQSKILLPKTGLLCKLFTYAPVAESNKIKEALFNAGAGKIGLYEECSFSVNGNGSFKPLDGANPTIGNVGQREELTETKIEVIFPVQLQSTVLKALFAAHPYETVAYEIVRLENTYEEIGSGLIGVLPQEVPENDFLQLVKEVFGVSILKHTALLNKNVKRVAVCGGSGSFLTQRAIAAGADVFITSDVKYHEFFDADNRILLVDIGHWESEQYTIELIATFLQQNFPTFAVLKTGVYTNPVRYK